MAMFAFGHAEFVRFDARATVSGIRLSFRKIVIKFPVFVVVKRHNGKSGQSQAAHTTPLARFRGTA